MLLTVLDSSSGTVNSKERVIVNGVPTRSLDSEEGAAYLSKPILKVLMQDTIL